MEPIFFPFTYASDVALTTLASSFHRFVVYQPSGLSVPGAFRDLQGNGSLIIRMPLESDEKSLAIVLRQYREWATLHQGQGLTYFRRFVDAATVSDGSSSSRIRDEIRHRSTQTTGGTRPDPVLETSVFLQLAQELDRQNAELDQALMQVSRRERALFEDLKGDGEETIPGLAASDLSPVLEDAGAYMTSERLTAWSRLMLNDPEHSGIYVTTSPAVFDHIKEDVPNIERVLSVALPLYATDGTGDKNLFQNSLADRLAYHANDDPGPVLPDDDKWCDGASGTLLTVHKVPGTTPYQFFSRFVASDQADGKSDAPAGRYPNTLVCLLETAPIQ